MATGDLASGLTVADGYNPYGSLLYANGYFYGMTRNGGANGQGVITPNAGFSTATAFVAFEQTTELDFETLLADGGTPVAVGDAGSDDAGPDDAGSASDAGTATDAGSSADAGAQADALPAWFHFGFFVESDEACRALYARMVQDKVEIARPLVSEPFTNYFFHDPDGHLVQVYFDPHAK